MAVRDYLAARVPRTYPQGGSGRLVSAAFADAAGPESFGAMYREFAAAAASGGSGELDVHCGLHVQRVIEAAAASLD